MSRYALSHRWQLIGLGLIALLALTVLFFVQAVAPTGPVGQHRPAGNEDRSRTMTAATLADAHPADRTFFTNDYTIDREATTRAYLLAGVHPADRKFFAAPFPAGIDPLAGAHPADRKFYAVYQQAGINPLVGVHPADRKFFANGYLWTAPAGEGAVEGH